MKDRKKGKKTGVLNNAAPVPSAQNLAREYLRTEPRPPLDGWFSRKQKDLGLHGREAGDLWQGLDREVRTLLRRLVMDGGNPEAKREKMALWGPQELAQVLLGCLKGPAPALPDPQDPWFSTACGLPPWLGASWEKRIAASRWTPAQSRTFLENLQYRPPLYIRLNGDPSRGLSLLESEGYRLESCCPGGWKLTGSRSLYLSATWKAGLVEIQDLASQKAGLLAQVRPGMRVWDVCAGEGGKSLLLAGELQGKGGLWGTDIIPKKVEHLKLRARKAGLSNLRPLVWDGKTFPDSPETRGKDFDVVLVDAPCSAAGTWRRDPEAALRLFPRDLPALTEIQAGLLRTAWGRLKPGGRLVYVTCSWLPEENEEVFDPFAAETGARVEFRGILGSPEEDSNTFWAGVAVKV